MWCGVQVDEGPGNMVNVLAPAGFPRPHCLCWIIAVVTSNGTWHNLLVLNRASSENGTIRISPLSTRIEGTSKADHTIDIQSLGIERTHCV